MLVDQVRAFIDDISPSKSYIEAYHLPVLSNKIPPYIIYFASKDDFLNLNNEAPESHKKRQVHDSVRSMDTEYIVFCINNRNKQIAEALADMIRKTFRSERVHYYARYAIFDVHKVPEFIILELNEAKQIIKENKQKGKNYE